MKIGRSDSELKARLKVGLKNWVEKWGRKVGSKIGLTNWVEAWGWKGVYESSRYLMISYVMMWYDVRWFDMALSCTSGQQVTSRTGHFTFAFTGSLHCSIDRIPPITTSKNKVFLLEAFLFECFLARSRILVSRAVRPGLRWQLSSYCVLLSFFV